MQFHEEIKQRETEQGKQVKRKQKKCINIHLTIKVQCVVLCTRGF